MCPRRTSVEVSVSSEQRLTRRVGSPASVTALMQSARLKAIVASRSRQKKPLRSLSIVSSAEKHSWSSRAPQLA